MPRSRRYL
jgi:hypothetical protein